MPLVHKQLRAELDFFRCFDGINNSEILRVFNITLFSLQIVSSIELFSWLHYSEPLEKNRAVHRHAVPWVADTMESTVMRMSVFS